MSDVRPVRFTTAGKVEAECWVGTISDVEHLVRVCRELRSHIEDGIVTRFNAESATRRAKFDAERYQFHEDDEHEARWEKEETHLRAELLESARLQMSVESGKWEARLSGDPEDVIREIDDPEDVKTITLSVGTTPNWRLRDRNSLLVRVNKYGAVAELSGHESNWIALASGKFNEEFKRTKPWYAWTRNPWGVMIVLGVPIGVLSLALNLYLTSLKINIVTASVFVVLVAFFVTIGAFKLAQFLTPRFRLYPSTHVLKSGRAIALSGAAWVLSVVVIPVLIGMLPH
ncbi:hypothetical protein ACFQ9V_05460 [Leifsonia sp. NPDC056665]|uniref:hypothetical protein n=1 Tax=Leifsonia sp. NPDC056665 TaxID=3345901 RepID=UPI0036AB4A99